MTELHLEKFDKIAVVTLDAPPVNALTLARYAAIGDGYEPGTSHCRVEPHWSGDHERGT